jgi:hypothetical protein
MSNFKHEEKCIGSSCPKKSSCKLYLNNAHESRVVFSPPYIMIEGTAVCLKYEMSYGDLIEEQLKKAINQ